MLLPSHEKVLRSYADSIRPIPVAPSKVITALFLPRNGAALKVNLDVSPSFKHAIAALDTLPKKGRFGNITLPDWASLKLKSAVRENQREIDAAFPRGKPSNFTYRAGVWLLLAIETVEPGFVSRWVRKCMEPTETSTKTAARNQLL